MVDICPFYSFAQAEMLLPLWSIYLRTNLLYAVTFKAEQEDADKS